MSFQNVQIEANDLPTADRLDFRSLDPAYPREVLAQGLMTWGVFFLMIAIPTSVVMTPLGDELVAKLPAIRIVLGALSALVMLIGLLTIPLAVRRARLAGYALRDHDVAFRRGLFFQKTIVLPFNRVQHAEVSTGPLQRLFGLASLKLYTAGASGVDLKIDGLSASLAANLRDHVTRRTGGAASDDVD